MSLGICFAAGLARWLVQEKYSRKTFARGVLIPQAIAEQFRIAEKEGSKSMLGRFRLIDLSVPLEHQAASEPVPAQIRYARHDGEGLRQLQHFLGVRPQDLVYSNGLGWAIKEVQAITHTGTHVDAPYHYGPISEGKPARTIDQIPLEWCLTPGSESI